MFSTIKFAEERGMKTDNSYYSLSIPIEARRSLSEKGYKIVDPCLSDSTTIILLPISETPTTTDDRFPLFVNSDGKRFCIDPCSILVEVGCERSFESWCISRGHTWKTLDRGSLVTLPFDMSLERYVKEVREKSWCTRVEFCLIEVTALVAEPVIVEDDPLPTKC